MKCLSQFCLAALLVFSAYLHAKDLGSPGATPRLCDPDTLHPSTPLEVLSHIAGVDFTQYFKDVLHIVRINWYNLIPAEARAPLMKKGCATIEFVIQKDGKVNGLKVVESSGDSAMERAAWSGIVASNPFPPLPNEYTGQYLKLRFHFYYNPAKPAKPAASEPQSRESQPAAAGESPQAVKDGAREAPPASDSGGPQAPKAESGSGNNATSTAPDQQPEQSETVYRVGQGVTAPRLTYSPSPEYTDRARKSKVQGTVALSVVVNSDGQVRHVKVTKSLTPDLDEQAVDTVGTWKFDPATRTANPWRCRSMSKSLSDCTGGN